MNTQKTIEETCVKCGKPILEGDGRYRFGSGTRCEVCGDGHSEGGGFLL